jgi:hypothetical protein
MIANMIHRLIAVIIIMTLITIQNEAMMRKISIIIPEAIYVKILTTIYVKILTTTFQMKFMRIRIMVRPITKTVKTTSV